MANLGSFDNDTVEIGGGVDYKLAGCVHAKVEPEEMFFGSWWLIMINLIRVWLIKLDGEKRSKSFAVLAAFSSSSLLCGFFFFFFFLAISSSASLEMPLNGLPRSMERNELKQKRGKTYFVPKTIARSLHPPVDERGSVDIRSLSKSNVGERGRESNPKFGLIGGLAKVFHDHLHIFISNLSVAFETTQNMN